MYKVYVTHTLKEVKHNKSTQQNIEGTRERNEISIIVLHDVLLWTHLGLDVSRCLKQTAVVRGEGCSLDDELAVNGEEVI
ncbi:hypothetical protein J6590_029323 [Homalodisca vitripennis]|nr:hypothetical protein J6590_029323 [Homalodisca vitripennis]